MARSSEMSGKIETLLNEIKKEKEHCGKLGRLDHWTGLIIMVVAILGSIAASACGFLQAGRTITGFVPLIPALAGTLGTTFKFDGRAAWHYERQHAMKQLERKLTVELQDDATQEEVDAVSKKLDEISKEMLGRWIKQFSLPFGSSGNAESISR